MDRLRRKESWPCFGVKLGLMLGIAAATACALASRYRIGLDVQQETSLPHHLYLIDRKDQGLERGALYAFSARGLAPVYPDGTRMVKQLVGLPGDEVHIDRHNRITINGLPVGQGLPLAHALQASPQHFQGRTLLPKDHYWFLGRHPNSLDSRYFGAVRADQVIGRAYALV